MADETVTIELTAEDIEDLMDVGHELQAGSPLRGKIQQARKQIMEQSRHARLMLPWRLGVLPEERLTDVLFGVKHTLAGIDCPSQYVARLIAAAPDMAELLDQWTIASFSRELKEFPGRVTLAEETMDVLRRAGWIT